MERRSGKYFGAGTALRQISLATGGTLSLNEVFRQITSYLLVYFLAQIAPKCGIWHQKSQKKFPEVIPPDSLSGRGRPPPAPTPSTATRRARGCKLPHCWDLGLGYRSPNQNLPLNPCTEVYIHRIYNSMFDGLRPLQGRNCAENYNK